MMMMQKRHDPPVQVFRSLLSILHLRPKLRFGPSWHPMPGGGRQIRVHEALRLLRGCLRFGGPRFLAIPQGDLLPRDPPTVPGKLDILGGVVLGALNLTVRLPSESGGGVKWRTDGLSRVSGGKCALAVVRVAVKAFLVPHRTALEGLTTIQKDCPPARVALCSVQAITLTAVQIPTRLPRAKTVVSVHMSLDLWGSVLTEPLPPLVNRVPGRQASKDILPLLIMGSRQLAGSAADMG
jgi:hypothetical protein